MTEPIREIVTEVTATETCKVTLWPDDFETWPPTAEQVRAKAIDVFENPDNGDRMGVDYRVAFDTTDLA